MDKRVYFSSERKLNKKIHTQSFMHVFVVVCLCEHLKVGKIIFAGGEKKKRRTKWALPFSCNFRKNAKQYPAALFTHCSGDIYLPNVKIMNNSIDMN